MHADFHDCTAAALALLGVALTLAGLCAGVDRAIGVGAMLAVAGAWGLVIAALRRPT